MVLYIVEPKVGEQCDHGDDDQNCIPKTIPHVWLGSEQVKRHHPKYPNRHLVLKDESYLIRSHVEFESNMLEGTQLIHVLETRIISILKQSSIAHIEDHLRNVLRRKMFLRFHLVFAASNKIK